MGQTIFVTAIGSFSAGAVIGACKREGYRVTGCDIYPAQWVVNSMETDVFYQAPYATDREAYRAFLLDVCRKEKVDYLMPLTDVEIDVLQQWRDQDPDGFAGLGAVVCMSGAETIRLCRNKEACEAFLSERGLCRTIPGQRLSDLTEGDMGTCSDEKVFAGLTYPLILKPLDGRSSQGLSVIRDPEEMAWAAKRCGNQAHRYLVQPKIDGLVVTVDVVRDPDTGNCVCLPRRELLRTLNGAGTSVQVFRNAELERQCREIAAALDVRGCVNFEFIEQGEQTWYFLECNPRFAGGVAFSCAAGYDMIKNHLNCFAGRPMEAAGEIRDQYIARRYTEYRMREETNDKEA